MKRSAQIIIILILGILFYFNSLGNKFVWDDQFLVRDNPHIRSITRAVGYAFSSSIYPPELFNSQSNYYRPTQTISYALDYFLWHANPFGFHLTSLLLHLLNALLVFMLFILLTKKDLIAFLTAIFFVIHPVNNAAVSYISGRADLLAANFILISLILFIKFRERKGGALFDAYFFLSLLSFFLALLSKEYALVTPLLFLAYDYCFGKIKKAGLLVYLSYIPIVAVYFLMRVHALGFADSFLGARYGYLLTGEFSLRFLSFFKSIGLYIEVLLLPINLHLERKVAKPLSIMDPWVIAVLLLLIICSAIFINRRRQRPLGLFLFLWFVILIFSQSYILLPGFSFAEHFLYLAALSFYLCFAVTFAYLFKRWHETRREKLVAIILSSFVLFYGSLTSIHNLNWKNNLVFFKWMLKFSPTSVKVHLNLANEYSSLGNYELALPEYERSLDLLGAVNIAHYKEKPILEKKLIEAITITHYNLGVFYSGKRDFGRAEYEYKQALAFDSNFHLARNNLAALLTKMDRSDEALEQLGLLLRLDPHNVSGYYNLGVIYANSGKVKQAKDAWQKGLTFDPANEKIRASLERLRSR